MDFFGSVPIQSEINDGEEDNYFELELMEEHTQGAGFDSFVYDPRDPTPYSKQSLMRHPGVRQTLLDKWVAGDEDFNLL